ncbi:MAG: ABC transporter ATP-binding protein [Candidatus Omnitrophica bacterium]|nr:ABC transporter ATP-binding protein [Candidatus Omnitrophota bacterium]
MKEPQGDIVKAVKLSKAFGALSAVEGIDFSVEKQECFGFLGPNGAGKTTTIKMVSCFLEPTSGVLEVLGKNTQIEPRFIKRHMGLCPQEDNLDPDLTVEDNLRVFARYFDITGQEARFRSEELLQFMGLLAKRKSHIDELSGGMKRRLMVARSLLNKPTLLILDEPTTGLDPQSRHQIWESLYKLKSEGTTILMTTHYMDEASHLCDRLVIMDHGKIIVQGSPKALVKQHMGSSVIEIASVKEEVEKYLKAEKLEYEKTSTHFFIYGKNTASLWPAIAGKFGEDSCALRMANLEDVFLKLTGRGLRDV